MLRMSRICLALLACALLASTASAQLVPSATVGDATIYDIADQCPPPTADLYWETLDQVQKALDDGSLKDDRLYWYLLENEELLTQDFQSLSDAVLGVRIEKQNVDDTDDGGQIGYKDGGVVRGVRWSFRNIFGWEVGSGQLNISWNNNANACHSKISGATHSGSIPLGSCKTKRVGAKFTRNCSPTADCEHRTQECGNYQIHCKQVFRFCRLGEAKTQLETICAPCP